MGGGGGRAESYFGYSHLVIWHYKMFFSGEKIVDCFVLITCYFNPSWPALPELRQGLGGGGQICPAIKKFQKKVENHFFSKLAIVCITSK